ncbi:MAG: YceI family protein [Candidatus Omnitrophica bacterium]|nr:YceI family protein [Candidatus Omnitrophota bacterium]
MHRSIASITLAIVIAVMVFVPAAQAATFKVDPAHSAVTFKIRHFVTKVPGRFSQFNGTIEMEQSDPATLQVDFEVAVGSINTDNESRDGHLRSPDFFDVGNFPTASFKSTEVQGSEAGMAFVTGDFTLHGVTKQIQIPVQLLGIMPAGEGKTKAGFETRFVIDRRDYAVSWNKVVEGSGILGDQVELYVSVEADSI